MPVCIDLLGSRFEAVKRVGLAMLEALVVDRPLGHFKAAIARVILCAWLSTLALFVPVSEAWLRDLVHYAVAALFFWITGMLILKLSPRLAGALLGGTVALLAATAIGSRIVVWATW